MVSSLGLFFFLPGVSVLHTYNLLHTWNFYGMKIILIDFWSQRSNALNTDEEETVSLPRSDFHFHLKSLNFTHRIVIRWENLPLTSGSQGQKSIKLDWDGKDGSLGHKWVPVLPGFTIRNWQWRIIHFNNLLLWSLSRFICTLRGAYQSKGTVWGCGILQK